jgi:hypothetical protein
MSPDDWEFINEREEQLVEKIARRVVALLDERRLQLPDPTPQTEEPMK